MIKFLRFLKENSFGIKVSLIALTVTALAAALVGGLIYLRIGGPSEVSFDNGEQFAGDFNSPATYNQPLIIKLADLALSISPLGANPAQAAAQGKAVKYIDAFANTDIVQTRYFNKLKEDIILKSPGHPEIFEYQIDLAQFDVSRDDQNNLYFFQKGHQGDNDYKRFIILAPFLIDAGGRKSSKVGFLLKDDGRLILRPSAAWLKQAKYPVVLDPTVEINVLTVHSHPQQGENWTVDFTTQGQADLRIIPNDQATIDDDEFVSLSCGNEKRQPQILANDIIFYPDWSCSPSEASVEGGTQTATVIHYTKKAGNHTLRFEFGGQTEYAYNSASPAIIFRSSPQSSELPCGGSYTVQDSEAHTYETVLMGSQCWMAENLNVGTYTAKATGSTDDGIINKHCYNEDTANCDADGGEYEWNEAMQYSTVVGAQGACMTGWHVPSDEEIKILEMTLGMTRAQADATGARGTHYEGDIIKAAGLCQGRTPCGTSGFNLHLPGWLNILNSWGDIGVFGSPWTSDQSGTSAWRRDIRNSLTTIDRNTSNKNVAYQIRCLRDEGGGVSSGAEPVIFRQNVIFRLPQ